MPSSDTSDPPSLSAHRRTPPAARRHPVQVILARKRGQAHGTSAGRLPPPPRPVRTLEPCTRMSPRWGDAGVRPERDHDGALRRERGPNDPLQPSRMERQDAPESPSVTVSSIREVLVDGEDRWKGKEARETGQGQEAPPGRAGSAEGDRNAYGRGSRRARVGPAG